MLFALVLELRHPCRLAELSVAVENPCELSVLGNMALNKNGILFGIEPERNKDSVHIHCPLAQKLRLGAYRNRVQVGDRIKAVVIIRHIFPVAKRSEVVA